MDAVGVRTALLVVQFFAGFGTLLLTLALSRAVKLVRTT